MIKFTEYWPQIKIAPRKVAILQDNLETVITWKAKYAILNNPLVWGHLTKVAKAKEWEEFLLYSYNEEEDFTLDRLIDIDNENTICLSFVSNTNSNETALRFIIAAILEQLWEDKEPLTSEVLFKKANIDRIALMKWEEITLSTEEATDLVSRATINIERIKEYNNIWKDEWKKWLLYR